MSILFIELERLNSIMCTSIDNFTTLQPQNWIHFTLPTMSVTCLERLFVVLLLLKFSLKMVNDQKIQNLKV